MSSLTDFISRQSTLSSQEKRITLITSKETTPVSLLSAFKILNRKVQFISLNEITNELLNSLPSVLNDFLSTGFDIVLTIQSEDTLKKSLQMLLKWKFQNEESKSENNNNAIHGNLYLLIDNIPLSLYPVDLQHLVDYEYQNIDKQVKL